MEFADKLIIAPLGFWRRLALQQWRLLKMHVWRVWSGVSRLCGITYAPKLPPTYLQELNSWKWRGQRSGSEVLNESFWQQWWHEKEPISPILYRSHILIIAQVRANGSYKWKIEKLRLKGSPPHPLFLSSLVPNLPEEINKIPDSKYWPLRHRRRESGANPLILISQFFICRTH